MPLVWPEVIHVYLSPHLDDAAFSCGGLIATQLARGESVAVVTLFAASPADMSALPPFAQELHKRWQGSAPPGIDFSDPPAARRVEDRMALATLGAGIHIVHYTLADCIYRRNVETGEALYGSRDAVFGEPHPQDPALFDLSHAPPLSPSAIVYAPLAIGGHVDHRIVRRRGEQWRLPSSRLWFYEDYPYVANPEASGDLAALQTGWESQTIALDEAALLAKIQAIRCYASQISSFWKDKEEMQAAIRQFDRQRGGERLWRRA